MNRESETAERLAHELIHFRFWNKDIRSTIDHARTLHGGHFRDEGTPYIEHPLRVALILAGELDCRDDELVQAALLHDVLEDCPEMTMGDLDLRYGDRVAVLVRFLTRGKARGSGASEESRPEYLARFAQAPAECILLKLCDRLDNLRSLPLSPRLDKRRLMVEETLVYLLPLCQGHFGVFHMLDRLICRAIEDVPLEG